MAGPLRTGIWRIGTVEVPLPEYMTPGAAGMDAGVAQMTQAEAIAADKALSDKPTTFTAELGAKKLTDQPCAGGSIVYHNKLTQGIEALRESFGQPESFIQGRRI